ncbi:MAG TPA: MFS transporter [Steroidobacteraceae bacterium]|jgi:MFS family permease|nr:MFS transporter [Steroidobacteraceae bacterium]
MNLALTPDRRWIYTAVLARSLATGMMGVLLGIYLASLDLDANAIGVVIGLGLAGAAFGTMLVTFFSDRFGRRRALLLITALSVVGAVLLATSAGPVALGCAAFIGMVNGMGRDRGAALVVEQSVLPATVADGQRTLAFAQYNVLQDLGHAAGSLLATAPALLTRFTSLDNAHALQTSVFLYALLSLLPLLAYLRLSDRVEAPRASRVVVSAGTRRVLFKLSGLFAIDAVGGGFLTTALLAYFFYERFGVGVESIGLLFFVARIANALSHFAAAWLAKRIGLVNTMVFTHIPSSVLLLTVPFMPTFPIAAALFLLRESLVEMDVPTRQSYVMAVVRPEERTFASGITHLVRMAGWAVAPAFAGLLMTGTSLAAPLLVGATLKILYDIVLWRAFRKLRPPEEVG